MFLRLVKKYPYQLETLDTQQLAGLRTRYIYAHLLRRYIIGKTLKGLPGEVDLQTIAPNVSPHRWSDVYPGGLAPFNNHVGIHVGRENREFWWDFDFHALKWGVFQADLRSRLKYSSDPPPASLEAFVNAVADAQDELKRLVEENPDTEDTLDEFGIRQAEP